MIIIVCDLSATAACSCLHLTSVPCYLFSCLASRLVWIASQIRHDIMIKGAPFAVGMWRALGASARVDNATVDDLCTDLLHQVARVVAGIVSDVVDERAR